MWRRMKRYIFYLAILKNSCKYEKISGQSISGHVRLSWLPTLVPYSSPLQVPRGLPLPRLLEFSMDTRQHWPVDRECAFQQRDLIPSVRCSSTALWLSALAHSTAPQGKLRHHRENRRLHVTRALKRLHVQEINLYRFKYSPTCTANSNTHTKN